MNNSLNELFSNLSLVQCLQIGVAALLTKRNDSMLTLRAKYNDGKIEFLDEVPFTGEHNILVTFLAEQDGHILVEKHRRREILEKVRESGHLLNASELRILRAAQKGSTNKEIAEKFEMAEGSVRNALSKAYSQLEARNRPEAIKKFSLPVYAVHRRLSCLQSW